MVSSSSRRVPVPWIECVVRTSILFSVISGWELWVELFGDLLESAVRTHQGFTISKSDSANSYSDSKQLEYSRLESGGIR